MKSQLLLLLALAACNGDDKSGDDTATAAAGPMTAVTFNAGLARGFVPAADARAPTAAEAIGALDADLVCLQEVWAPEHVAMVEEAAADAFPYAHFPEPAQEILDEPACDEGELDTFLSCVDENCSDACTDELVDCVFDACAPEFLWLASDKTCVGCVMANVGSTSEEVRDSCENQNVLYAYDGSYGIGLLSRTELGEVDEHVFDSSTNRRMVMHAVVDTPAGAVDAYCTHLTAVFSGPIPYPHDEGSWAEEQAAQIADMLAWIDETRSTDHVLLMGDLNTGPEVGEDVVAEVGDNWELFAATGWAVPYVDEVGACTYCDANPLVGGEGGQGSIIDHVIADGFDGPFSGERILEDTFTVDRCGEEIPAAISDHYGVKVTLDGG